MEHDQKDKEVMKGWEFLVEIPSHAGRPVGMAVYRGKLIITTEHGHLYMWDGDAKELELINYLPNTL